MGHTDGRWTQSTSSPDLQLFIGADRFKDTAALATLTLNAAGILYNNVPATDASIFIATVPLPLRSGIYATPSYDQEQFGTAAAQPGPSMVSGTSGPLAVPGPFPPTLGASMATVAGPTSGPSIKGIQIDSLDIIYQVTTVAATLAQVGLTKTLFTNLAAPVVSNIITLGANGLPTAISTGTHPAVTNVLNASPAMIQAADTQLLLNVKLTAGTGGTIQFYGAVVKAHFNFN